MVTLNLIIQGLINGLLLGGVYALVSVGLTLSFGVIHVANSAQMAFAVLGSFISYWLFVLYGLEPILSILPAVGILFVIGLITHKFLISRVVGGRPLMIFTLTFFLAITLENVMVLLWKNEYRSIITWYTGTSIPIGDFTFSTVRIIAFTISMIMLSLLALFLKYTYTGKAMRALTQSREASLLMGVNVDRLYLITYGVSVALAGAAGPLLALIYTFYPSMQAAWIGKLYVIVMFGGRGSIFGTLIAALLIGLCDVAIGVFVPVMWGSVFSWIILMLTLLFRPKGLFGK